MKSSYHRQRNNESIVNNDYLSLIFQNTSDLFCLLEIGRHKKLTILSVNPSYVEAAKEFNPEMTADTFIGRSIEEIMYEEYHLDEEKAREVLSEYEKTLKVCQPRTFTEEIEFKGVIRYYSSTITPIKDQKGNCTHLLYCSKDISEKIYYERNLKQKEAKFRALIENSNECIAVLDHVGHITYISPSIKTVAGYEERDFQGPRLQFVHPEDSRNNESKFLQVIKDPEAYVTFRFRLKHARGHYIWIETTLTNLLDKPEVNGVVSNFRDITAQKFAEDQIAETKQLLETVNQNISEGIYRIVPGGNFKYVNQAFLDLFGFDSIESLNKCGASNIYDSPDGRQYLAELLDLNKTVENIEIKFKRKDGSVFWGLVSASLIHLSKHEKYIDGAVRDITQLKLAEQKLTELNNELRKQNMVLATREEELNRALQELSDRNFELDQLVYKTSHDLRSPLTSILGLVNIAKIDNAVEQQSQYLSRIEHSILKLDEFVKSMLNFAKASRSEVEIKPLELQELLENCVKDLEYLNNFQKIRTSISLHGRGGSFSSDPLRLKIIFSNIISNAYKYYNPDADDSYLDIIVNFTPVELNIAFKDNGIGIHKSHLDKIYDMFYRATEASEGSGLGMYIVKQSVQKLGGSIAVESTPKKGTTFMVVIPSR